ncbi:MAG: thrombospondin type 3 repeat-containing protein, partial [Acetatifactor sp.]|nr:thrombospondin type 3 repeat-containing protein [Acetatifactor sp.]
DGDGLNNYFESIYGTDPLLADTDSDGLTDWEELTQTGTNPILEDTDGNGILDGAEDFDGDGLSNQEEIAAGTGVLYPDSDGDGLSDGEEVLVYHTNPLVADTDSDGLSDGEDIKLGFDPLKPDTDENGILDGDEVVRQTCTQELDPERKEGITQVSVSMDCAGYIDNQVLIQNLYNLDMRSTDVVGLFGAPVEIETEIEFDTATITFTYDEQALGETDADNLRIMWYDEEDDRYVILDEETVLDKEHHTLSCSTTHFSKWMVVDRQVWWTAMRADLGYGEISDSGEYYFDYAYAYNWGRCLDEYMPYLPDNNQLYDTEYARYSSLYGIDTIRNIWKPQEYQHGFKEMSALEVINYCIDRLNNDKSHAKNKQLYFFDLKDIKYDSQTVQRAIDGGIAINCITASYANKNSNMMRMVSETGGKYLEVQTWNKIDVTTVIYDEINAVLNEYRCNYTDSDKDGLYDIYEEKGFRLSNGRIVYTSPLKYDSDDDGINDFLYVGGLARAEKCVVDGEEFTSMVNRGGVYPELSADFIYVDGRMNANGVVNDERMGYVSYSNQFYYDKYEKSISVEMFEEVRKATGAAGVHG